MENINSVILAKGYGLKLISCTRTRTGLLCRTDKGVKELKKVYSDEKTVLFEDAVKRHLKQRGFHGVNIFLLTTEGAPFFNYDDTMYVLEDYVPVKSADLTDKETMKKAILTLADMHFLAEDFSYEEEMRGPDLINLYEKRKTELLRIIGRLKKGRTINSCDRIVLTEGMRFVDRADEAVKMLKDAGYSEMNKNTVCHNCYKGDNIRTEEATGNISVTGFSKCAFDIGTVDLAEFIRRFYKDTGCAICDACEIVDIYGTRRRVDKDELKIIFAMLLYPAKFFKLCNNYYNKRSSFVSYAVEEKFSRCCERAEREGEFLKTLRLHMLN